MKYFGIALLLFAFPLSALATCSSDGFTVVYINGIKTTNDDANKDKKNLAAEFNLYSRQQNVTFLTGYNPSHLGGFGDLIKSAVQADKGKGSGIDDFDARTILMQIAPDVKTQKVLLVGHSQGTFYTNALYDYLTTHGVSKDAVGVYNVATPANFVAGNGAYLTSSNDRVVQKVALLLWGEVVGLAPYAAQAAGMLDAIIAERAPLTANITLSLGSDPNDMYAGHSMGEVYLAEAPERIASDINKALTKLHSSGTDSDTECFTAPAADFKYKTKEKAFSAVDPLAGAVFAAVGSGFNVVAAVAKAGYGAAAAALSSAASGARSILPVANKETAINAFPVVRLLYGSGVDQPGLNDLNNDDTFYSGTAPARQPSAVALAPAVLRPAPQAPTPPPPAPPPSAPPKPETPNNPLPKLIPLPVSPGFGGGGGGSSSQSEPPPESPPAPTGASALAITSPADNVLFATTSITVIGTSTPSALIFASFGSTLSTTTADGTGNWSFSLTLTEGTTTASFSVLDAGASGTTTLSRSVTVDTTPPSAPALAIAECADTLSTSGCLLPRTSATLSWNDISDAAYYAIASGGTWLGTTTATTAAATLTDQSTAHFKIVALDLAGNVATSSAVDAAAYLQPIVINEVAWAGTDADSDNQWLELKNRTPYDLDLSQLALYSPDSILYVPLSGTIGSTTALLHGNLALIYKNSAPLMGAVHQQQDAAFSFATSSPIQLALAWASGGATTTLDSTPTAGACSSWCAGAYQKTVSASLSPGASSFKSVYSLSMERTDASADGASSGSWADNDLYTTSVSGFGGTPGNDNSSHWPEAGFFCYGDSAPPADGASYHLHSENDCTFLSRFISEGATRDLFFYTGTVGSATLMSVGFLSSHLSSAEKMDFGGAGPGLSAGDQFFAAIFENRGGGDDVAFDHYFKGTAVSPPHTNYRVIQLAYQ